MIDKIKDQFNISKGFWLSWFVEAQEDGLIFIYWDIKDSELQEIGRIKMQILDSKIKFIMLQSPPPGIPYGIWWLKFKAPQIVGEEEDKPIYLKINPVIFVRNELEAIILWSQGFCGLALRQQPIESVISLCKNLKVYSYRRFNGLNCTIYKENILIEAKRGARRWKDIFQSP